MDNQTARIIALLWIFALPLAILTLALAIHSHHKRQERVKEGSSLQHSCPECSGELTSHTHLFCTECDAAVVPSEPQPQLPPQPELDSSAILAAMDVYDDSSNNMVNVGSGLDYFEDVLGNDSISLDEEEVYNALKKVAEAGLDYVFDYVYFYQT